MKIMINKLNENELLEKCGIDKTHMLVVSKLACSIFDKLNGILFLYEEQCREYLRIAALLHDIGYYVDKKKHNKHSFRLIKENLANFEENECMIIANIARYHRGAMPDKYKHKNYYLCDKNAKKIIKNLSSILKIADGLDCLHKNEVEDIDIKIDKKLKIITFYVKTYNKNLSFKNFKTLLNKKNLFECVFNIQVLFFIN